MDKEPITINGLQNLKTELDDLKNVQRPKIVEAIAEARSHGDLKENAEYHAAKEQQALIESRVIAINDLIARANVIDVTKIENNGKVIFGATVKLQDLDADKKITFPLFSIFVTSITFARAIISFIAITLLSIKACCSFAAWYSAFSFKSP